MGNLFVKTFIGFWLVTGAVLASWMFMANYFDERPPHMSAGGPPPGPPHRLFLRFIYDLQNLESTELEAAAGKISDKHGIVTYALDQQGKDLFGKPVPAEVTALAEKLDGRRRRAFENTPRGRMIAHDIYRSDTGPLRAVFVLKPPAGPLLQLLGSNPWLRILIGALVSGVICYALSRVLTSRLQTLGTASRQLAEGDLNTRLDVREHGGDETDELARAFNTMAAQLQERIQSQKQLLSDVSHELRSPLARLRIALALAQEDKTGSAGHLARIEQESERLEELIAQLLSSRATDLQLDAHIDLPVLLKQLCEDANFEGMAQGKSASFSSDCEQALVLSSAESLRRSFENILRNALAHTAEDTVVNVVLQRRDSDIVVTIEDRGPGVPEQELDRIFGEFYRVDTARTRESGGYGLGLAIARRAVQQHGGSVRADNTGKGLRITVYLPIAQDHPRDHSRDHSRDHNNEHVRS